MVLATKRAVYTEYERTGFHRPPVKVRRVKRSTSPLAGIFIIALIFVLGLSYTYIKASKAHLIWQLNQSKEKTLAMQLEIEKLRLEVARLKSLNRIEEIAVNQMGMVKNPRVEYLAFSGETASRLQENAVGSAGRETTNKDTIAETPEKRNLLEIIASAFTKGNLAEG